MRQELILLAATFNLVNAQVHVTPSIDPEVRDHTRPVRQENLSDGRQRFLRGWLRHSQHHPD